MIVLVRKMPGPARTTAVAMAAASAAPSASLVSFVSGDGVRIHSEPNASSTVLGLAYSGDNRAELAGSSNTYADGTDARTGQLHRLVLSARLLRVRGGGGTKATLT
ncbi:hypothetical protein [Streptomyces sp. NPDC048200]|uniref:hypothetical protein n=1 Tax=Streptomyces sp. NPDC048200 TaxID=3365512 RepID=UPI00371DE1BC